MRNLSKLPEQFKAFLEPNIQPCLVCQSNDLIEFASQDYMTALKCVDCGMISQNPYMTAEGVTQFYTTYFDNRIADEEKMFELRKDQYVYDRDFLEKIINKGSILDIGASGGNFMSNFNSDRWKRKGIDLTDETAKYAAENFGIDVKVGDVLNYQFGEKFDVVSMRGVIEHFKDPRLIFSRLPELVKSGGYFFVSATPAGDSFAFDVYRGFWRLFTPLEHVHFFSVDLISRCLGDNFKLVASDYPYQGTPYCSQQQDFEAITNDIISISQGEEPGVSRAFPGNIFNAVWKYTGT